MLSADSFGTKRLQAPEHAGQQLSSPQARARVGMQPPAMLIGSAAASLNQRLQMLDAKHTAEHTHVFQVLVVDDDAALRKACSEIVAAMGFHVVSAASVAEARLTLSRQAVDLLLLDLKLPGDGGLVLLEETKKLHPETSIVVMTAFATVSSAVEAMRIGAGDYLTKPFAREDLTAVLQRAGQRRGFNLESRRLRERLRLQIGMGGMIGQSPEMQKLYRILAKVVSSSHPVLILGESGTGKELVARSIHVNGPHSSKPFVPVDCGALAPTLIESELFGYAKGAFTGANRSKEGLLSSAGGGTIFLDEIGELPLDLQAKLLRALQEKEVRPVGATQAVPISARILAATNRDLTAMVEQGKFRKDLYYRLNVVNIKIPALRERKADIIELASFFLERLRRDAADERHFSQEALALMLEYDWPGNVRELENAIEHVCTLSTDPLLEVKNLPTQLIEFDRQNWHRQVNARSSANGSTLDAAADPIKPGTAANRIASIADMEREAILGTIQQLKGDKLMAAKLLGIGKTTLYRKLKEYGITESE